MATVLRFGVTQSHVKNVQLQLWTLIEERQLVTVHTKTKTYENMLLVRAPMSRRPEIGDAAIFSLEFQQLRIVRSEAVSIPSEVIATPKLEKGLQTPKEIEKTSVAYDLARRFLGVK